jgi:hypothetical protein
MMQTGTSARHVPYQQLSQATADLLNGTNQFQFIAVMPVLGLITTGKLRAIAVTAPHRIAVLQDVPTVQEAGYPGLVAEKLGGFRRQARDTRINRAALERGCEPGAGEAKGSGSPRPTRVGADRGNSGGFRLGDQGRGRALDPSCKAH